MKYVQSIQVSAFAISAALALTSGATVAHAQAEGGVGIQNRTIGYVMVFENRSIFQAKDAKTQCPVALNDGPPEQFKKLYPENGARNEIDTRLAWEGELWNPTSKELPVPYYEVQGKVGRGMNLDGKVDENDYTSPDTGEKGIDNQIYRTVGCTYNYRDGQTSTLTPQWRRATYNIFVIELTDVDSLVNDDDVTLTTYRGLDKLMTDATGGTYLPGGTQRLDMRWGKPFIQKFKGKIKDGVLTTEGADYVMPSAANGSSLTDVHYYKTQWRLNVLPERAEGVMGGYMDIQDWNAASNQQRSTHHQAYGQAATPSIYRAMRQLADYKDAKTGEMTAISMALGVKFTQVFVKHPDATVSANSAPGSAKTGEE